ncbi:MAG: TIGR03364 family FAD-dependent oxidoreductase [Gaiellaceae bacterium]
MSDVAIVGAGIVGVAHAVDAVRRGLSVTVVERDDRPNGASVRNFGHLYPSAQAGFALQVALEARGRWLELADEAGFWLLESGTLLVARLPEELAAMEEFAATAAVEARVLTRDEVLRVAPVSDSELLGGLTTPLDCRVHPREALPALCAWLHREKGVSFLWGATALGAERGVLWTSRGEVRAEAIVIAAGHDIDRLLPDTAEEAGMRRCSLHMLRITAPDSRSFAPALGTGLALLRYSGFAGCPSVDALRIRIERERPELLAEAVNLLVTQRPDGDLVVGDTHHYAHTPSPFRDERRDDLLLEEATRLLGGEPLTVRERWQGIYAHAPDREFLIAAPSLGVRAVVVTTGIGMTTALGLAPHVLDGIFDHTHVTL